ncbi:uncharacterized protein LOC142768596 isoform X1 [Rhipicephalus microplus]|uniref:uncharacterized protein LOC142768596 isoform X1 n=1 Tax=Rhipicephalus microplus TaxID=6941 RepID=UPI003F6AAE5C
MENVFCLNILLLLVLLSFISTFKQGPSFAVAITSLQSELGSPYGPAGGNVRAPRLWTRPKIPPPAPPVTRPKRRRPPLRPIFAPPAPPIRLPPTNMKRPLVANKGFVRPLHPPPSPPAAMLAIPTVSRK